MGPQTNPAERRRWNDERWTNFWPRRERFTDSVTPSLFEAAALQAGERVVDIGCGGGKTTIEAGRRVGSAGTATGADLSAPLVGLARRRAEDAGSANVDFFVCDMQHDLVPGAPFDVAVSQFGVMFFDEPGTAFANIASQLRPGGRIAFACWQEAERNPWVVSVALAPFLTPPPAPEPGKSPTGPFALADAARTTAILSDAGFSGIERTAVEIAVDLPEDAVVDDDQLAFMGIADTEMPAARAAVDTYFEQFRVGPGVSRFPLAFQLFAASR